MNATLQAIRQKYGSIEGYAHEACGLTNQEINAFREGMVIPIRFEERQLFRPRI